jgi:hypothetical protein
MQSSEGVDDITKIKIGAIFGGGRRYHRNQNRRNYWSDLPGDLDTPGGERVRQKDGHRAAQSERVPGWELLACVVSIVWAKNSGALRAPLLLSIRWAVPSSGAQILTHPAGTF